MKNTILKATAEGRTALIPFLTAGFPSPDLFWDKLEELDACGVDIIEVGVPFSDPVADGPVIEEASRRALESGVNLAWTLQGLKARKGRLQAKILLMGYVNPFLQYGLERLGKDCSESGVSGFIVPDLPLEESFDFRRAIAPHGLELIPLVGPNTSSERMKAYAPYAKEYVYVVSILGTTGSANRHIERVADTMRRAREAFNVPLALGFGLHDPSQLDLLPQEARPDAAVIGTALLRHIESGAPIKNFFAPWLRR